jgi:hypothetical protein
MNGQISGNGSSKFAIKSELGITFTFVIFTVTVDLHALNVKSPSQSVLTDTLRPLIRRASIGLIPQAKNDCYTMLQYKILIRTGMCVSKKQKHFCELNKQHS